ncbi:MAG: transcriptional regulator GcvA [Rhodocyclaceae bacterium]|nr:transcriptional regulator GcvA [Rhodocyclaceae bacterium]
MARSLPPLLSLRVFESCARLRSFKRAAEELHVTPAAVSHQIKALEEHLGVALFRRLTRQIELTPSAELMLPKIREGLDCFVAAVDAVRPDSDSGTLTICLPPSLASRWLIHRLQDFSERHPEIQLRVGTNLSTIDSHDGSAGEDLSALREGRVDLEVRFGSGEYEGMDSSLMFEVSYLAVCAPGLLKGKRPLRHPRDLSYHTLIHDDTVRDRSERPNWADWLAAACETGVDASRGPHFSNSSLALEAAMDGMGVALALRPLLTHDIAAGRLVVPFDVAVPSGYAYHVVTTTAASERTIVRRFKEWLLEESHRLLKRADELGQSGTA